MIRFLFIIFLTGIAFPALGHEPKGKAKKIDFSKMKQARLESLDKRRACISKSTNIKQLRACGAKRKKKSY